MIRCIEDVEDRELFWAEYGRVRKHLEAAAKHNEDPHWEQNLIKELLFDKCSVLWTGDNSAAVTEVGLVDHRVCLIINLLGGDMEEIIQEGQALVEAYAKQHGCKCTKIYGRDGWRKVLPKYGYKLASVVMTKEIE